ncbi:MAG: tRNA pseudouridine(55) synthase TruB [Bernardetiaceae bacterium]|jgi:tRNA pseudouridine55 synthase|nr:tRNA pseudouridine(55) synthase TruB [Bernardetiaceae bacterium]
MPTPAFNFETGEVLLVNKPFGWTSFDVVNKLRFAMKVKKIGHAGTLDPLATGLLVICTGKFTKQIEQFQAQEKEYTGTLVLGQTTPSDDAETEPTPPVPVHHLTPAQLAAAAQGLTGPLSQMPPMFSAVKVGGERLYKKARRGEVAELAPRAVHIHEFALTRISLPEVDFRVVCSKGTYIRSLARDFGAALGVGAYLRALCRTRNGALALANAWELEPLVEAIKAARLPPATG